MARIVYPGIRDSIGFEPWYHNLFTDRQNKLCAQFISRAFNVYNNINGHWRLQSAIEHWNGSHLLFTPVVIVGRKWADTGVYDEIENLNNGGIAFAGLRENDPGVQNRPFNWVFQQWLNVNYDYANAYLLFNAFAFNVRWQFEPGATCYLQWWKDPNMCAELTRWWQAFGNDGNFRFGMLWKGTYQHDNIQPYLETHASYIGANEQGGWTSQGGQMVMNAYGLLQASRIFYLTLEQYNPASGQWVTRANASFDEQPNYEVSYNVYSGVYEYYPSFNGQYLEYPRNLHQLVF